MDAEEAAMEVLSRMNASRAERGQSPLEWNDSLVALAEEGCQDALSVTLDDVPSRIAPAASRAVHARVAVSVHSFYEMDTLDFQSMAEDDAFEQVGLALLRDPESNEGRTFLVIIAADSS